MFSLERPGSFSERYQEFSAIIEYRENGLRSEKPEILLHHSYDSTTGRNLLGLPNGRLSPGTDLSKALENSEINNRKLDIASRTVEVLGKAFIRTREGDVVRHIVRIIARDKFTPNSNYIWATPENALASRISLNDKECIKLVYGIKDLQD